MSMLNIIKKFVAPPEFADVRKTYDAKNVNTILNLVVVIGIIGLTLTNIVSLIRGKFQFFDSVTLIATGILFFALVFKFILSKGYVRFVSTVYVLLTLIAGLWMVSIQHTIVNMITIIAILPIIMATYLLGKNIGLAVFAIVTTVLFWISYQQPLGTLGPPTSTTPIIQWMIFLISTAILFGINNLFRNNLIKAMDIAQESEQTLLKTNTELRDLQKNLELRVQERTQDLEGRTAQVETIAEVARSIATIREMDLLLPRITELISERFGFYHVGVFLLDSNKEFAVLRAANSAGGQKMLARKHRLRIGQQGIVGYAIAKGKARVALNVGEESVFFDNPDLPETQSEVALPLIYGREIIGALDIQSTQTNAFSEEDLELFATLADQVSIAIQNTESLNQAQRALHDAEIATQQLTAQAWETYTQTMAIKGYRFDGNSTQPLDETYQVSEEGTLRIPIRFREQEVASLVLEHPTSGYEWTEDDITMAQVAADRTALALERARLLEESQRRAGRERLVSDITTKIRSTNDPQEMIQTALNELKQALGASKIELTTQMPKVDKPENVEER